MNEAFDLVKVALLYSDSLNHRGHEPAVLAPAHLSAKQRLPRSWLKVFLIDKPKTTSCGARLTIVEGPLTGLHKLKHADLGGLRLVWLRVRDSKRPERSDNRRSLYLNPKYSLEGAVAICEPQVLNRNGGRLWTMLQPQGERINQR